MNEIQREKRVYAVGDIHGHNLTFRKLLFSKFQLQREDTLYILGDMIDRGDDSYGVIETILTLLDDGYDIRSIRGNHEQMLLNAYQSRNKFEINYWLGNGGVATLASYGAYHPREIPREHIEFLNSLPNFRTDENFVYVHAGLDFNLDDPLSEEGEYAMLWTRKMDVIPEKIGNRKVVVGHTVYELSEIINSLKSDLIRLDNGCFVGVDWCGMGNLVGLEMNSMKLYVQENIG